jgi:hypothetical protein
LILRDILVTFQQIDQHFALSFYIDTIHKFMSQHILIWKKR